MNQHEQTIRNAQYQLRKHDHPARTTKEMRESCSACALNGYNKSPHNFINNAGWARVWIQAGKYIEPKYFFPFLAELGSDNRSYAEALKADIREFGINLPKTKEAENFKAAVQDILGIYEEW